MAKGKSYIFLTFLQIVLQIVQIKGTPAAVQTSSLVFPEFNSSYPVPVTTIERVETFSNGCFKQIIKEPDFLNTQRFYQSEQLICPSGVNASILADQLQKNSTVPVPAVVTVFQPALSQYPVPPSNVSIVESTNFTRNNMNNIMSPQVPSNNAVQVIDLSKKVGFYEPNHGKNKSSANSLSNFNGHFMFLVIAIFLNFN